MQNAYLRQEDNPDPLIPILNQSAIFVGSVVGFLNVFVRNGLKPFPTLLLAASISSLI
jgi:hypothetical protein